SGRIGRAAARAVLAVAAETGGAVLEGSWPRDRAADLAGLPGRIVEVFCRADSGSEVAAPVAGGWPVLEADATSPVGVDRLLPALRRAAR
ncbi:MAG: hypothetical protein ACRDWY_09725, partial [Actinomycetes bacterium]